MHIWTRKQPFEKSRSKDGPQKSPQALWWLEKNISENEGPKTDLQKAPQALRWLENSTSKNEGPNMGLQKAQQALRWLENITSKNQGTNGIGHDWSRHASPRAHTQPGRRQTLSDGCFSTPSWAHFALLYVDSEGFDQKTLNPTPSNPKPWNAKP